MSFDAEPENPFFLAKRLAPLCERYLLSQRSRADLQRSAIFAVRDLKQAFPGKSAWDLAQGLHPSDPLRLPLLRWVSRLTEARVNALWTEEDARQWSQLLHVVAEPREQQASLEQMQQRALRSSSKEAELWWRQQERFSASLSEHRLEAWRRVKEVSARLGAPLLHELFEPVEASATQDSSESVGSAFALAQMVMKETAELLPVCEFWGEQDGWRRFCDVAGARALGEGWPARLAPDTLLNLLQAPVLLRSVRPEPGELPQRIFPLSFGRALARVGRSLQLAYAPQDVPRIFALDVDALDSHELGQLLLLWSFSQTFDQRILGQGRHAARERRRHFARALLCHLSLSATRVQLMHYAAGEGLSRDAHEDLTRRLLGQPLPWSTALVRLQLARNESVRLVALLHAAARYQQFCSEFDEDWLLSPRAQEKVRADFSGVAQRTRPANALVAGLEFLVEQLRAELD